jgi:hypothetical protein
LFFSIALFFAISADLLALVPEREATLGEECLGFFVG